MESKQLSRKDLEDIAAGVMPPTAIGFIVGGSFTVAETDLFETGLTCDDLAKKLNVGASRITVEK